jgi:IS5 family transposase
MRPKRQQQSGSGDLFRARLDQIINMRHELVVLGQEIDWGWLDEEVGTLYASTGRAAVPSRFILGLLFLKQIHGLSDEQVCERWICDPYFQYFTGEEFFRHELPHDRSNLTNPRERFGDKLDLFLAETLRVAEKSGALNKADLARVTVDTTVQPKNVTFPTDAKLLVTAINKLGELAKERGVKLRQSYVRVAKHAAMMAGRYAHAKQFKRHERQMKFLRARLRRLIRDIRRKTEGNGEPREIFAFP